MKIKAFVNSLFISLVGNLEKGGQASAKYVDRLFDVIKILASERLLNKLLQFVYKIKCM